MMFHGSHNVNMDAKGRIIVPAKVRDVFAAGDGLLFVTGHPEDRCCMVFGSEKWQSIKDKIEAIKHVKYKRKLRRIIWGLCEEVVIDSAGRIPLSAGLRNHGSFEKELILVGQGDCLELWSQSRWNTNVELMNDSSDDDVAPEDLIDL